MEGCPLGGALPDGTGGDRLISYARGRIKKAWYLNMKEKGNTMTKEISGRCWCRYLIGESKSGRNILKLE